MKASILFNADVGEGCGDDAALMPWLDQANIACGAHAGNRQTMARAVTLAMEHGCALGAHPGYADRAHFGRRPLSLPARELESQLRAQLEALADEVAQQGGRLAHVKFHGALYNQAVADERLAEQLLDILERMGLALPLMTLPGGELARQAAARGLEVIAEGFADRRYDDQGRLLPRSHPQAMLHDPEEAVRQARALAAQGVQSLCVHGDNPEALAFVRALRQGLSGRG